MRGPSETLHSNAAATTVAAAAPVAAAAAAASWGLAHACLAVKPVERLLTTCTSSRSKVQAQLVLNARLDSQLCGRCHAAVLLLLRLRLLLLVLR
jgi:hypothetical protein